MKTVFGIWRMSVLYYHINFRREEKVKIAGFVR